VPTVVVGMYAPFGVAGVYDAGICMPWAFIVALWHVEDPTMGAYIATTGVATYAPPARTSAGCRGAKPRDQWGRDTSRPQTFALPQPREKGSKSCGMKCRSALGCSC
jgi:hypothetical protein